MTQILNLGTSSHDNEYSVYNSRFIIIQNDLFENILKREKYQNELCCSF